MNNKDSRYNDYNGDPNGFDSGDNLMGMLDENLEEFDSEHFHEFFTYAGDNYREEFGPEAEETVERGRIRERKKKRSLLSAFFYLIGQRIKSRRIRKLDAAVPADPVIREPKNIPKEAAKYSRPLGSMVWRSRIALVICAAMIYLTLSFTISGRAAVIENNSFLLVSVLMIMQLVTMLLCLEVPITGIISAARGEPGAETLITASFIFTFTDSAVKLLTGDMSQGLPFSAVSALSAVFGLRGMMYYNSAVRDSLRVLSKVKLDLPGPTQEAA